MEDLPVSIGPYRVVRRLGEGGMGAVYEARNEAIGRRVAIKVLHPEFVHSPDLAKRFFNEARAVNLVDHPGVVQVSDYGQLPDGTAYIVMEYLKGESLGRRLQRTTLRLPIGEVLQIGWQIADTIAAAHQKNIVHRDLKPDNVMLVPDPHTLIGERAKVLDFGIAKLAGPEATPGVQTQTRLVMGTPSYMSPEQCLGAGGVDARSDVYALGCILYEMLTGQPPHVGVGAGLIMSMHMTKEPEPLLKLAPGVPPPLAELVHRLLRKDREQRPSMARTAGELERMFKLAPAPGKKHFDPGSEDPSDVTRFVLAPSTLGMAAAQTRILQRKHLWMFACGGAALMALLLGFFLRSGDSKPLGTAARAAHAFSAADSAPQSAVRLIKLRVESDPPGAAVVQISNGEILGKTPWSMSLPSGSGHLRFRLQLAGHVAQEISLSKEESNGMQVRLAPQPKLAPARPGPIRRPSNDLFGPRQPVPAPATRPKATLTHAKPPIED